jgi:hypothetical protein
VRSTTFVFKDLCTCIEKWSFSISKTGTLSRCRPERCRVAPLGVRARGHHRPRRPAIPGHTPYPGRRHTPRRLDCPVPRASPSPRRTRATHAADRRFIRGLAVRALVEERRSTAASRPSSPHRHRRSIARPIKGASASPRAGTEPPAAIATLAPSSTLPRETEPTNHFPPVPRPC